MLHIDLPHGILERSFVALKKPCSCHSSRTVNLFSDGFKATSQSKCVANKTCCSSSKSEWLLIVLHNFPPDCLMMRFRGFCFTATLLCLFFFFDNERQVFQVIKLKNTVVKYATFPRCIPLGQKSFLSVLMSTWSLTVRCWPTAG